MADVATLDSEQILVMLQEIGKAADKIKLSVTGMGEASTKHMKNAGEAMAGVDKQIVSMTKNLLGPVGLAAGFFAVAKSLDSFAVGQLQLSNLAKNTGLAASSVLQLQTKFEVAGLGAEGFSRTIGGITSALNNIKTFEEGSDVFGKISQMFMKIDGKPLESVLLQYERAHDRLGGINTLVKAWNQGTERQKLYIEELAHTDAAGMAAMQEDLRGVILLTEENTKEAKEYHKQWVSLKNIVSNVGTAISQEVVKELNNATGGMQKLDKASQEFSKNFITFFKDNVAKTIGSTATDILNIVSGFEKLEALINRLTGGGKDGGNLMGRAVGSAQRALGIGGKPNFSERFGDWGEGETGELPKGARPRSYSGTGDVDSDSNKMLHDIRDMMQRSEIRQAGAGGSGGGGGSSGGGGSGPIFRQGIGGMGGTRGNRNNNRGNIKFGEFAKSMGATHADERGFAVFPDQASGDAAHAALVKQPQYQGLTLDQFGNKYSEGNADWKSTVGKALGIGPNDKVDTSDPRLLEGIRQAEGTAGLRTLRNYGMDPMARAGTRPIGGDAVTTITSPSGRSFTVAKEFAPNFQGFINEYEKSGGLIGPSSGGLAGRGGNASYHPLGRAIDVNQEGYGIRSRSGVTLPQNVEDALAEKYGLYPGSQFRNRSDIGHFEVRNAEAAAEARERLNKSMRGATVNGELNANVNFSNVPPGVKTNAEGSGFKKLRITSSKQGQKANEGMVGPGDPTYGTWVP